MPNYQERSELLRQLANQAYFDAKNKPNPQKDNVQIGGFDGRTGRYQVINADGGVSSNGVSLSNAAPPSDRFVRGIKNPNTNAVPMEWRQYQDKKLRLELEAVEDNEELLVGRQVELTVVAFGSPAQKIEFADTGLNYQYDLDLNYLSKEEPLGTPFAISNGTTYDFVSENNNDTVNVLLTDPRIVICSFTILFLGGFSEVFDPLLGDFIGDAILSAPLEVEARVNGIVFNDLLTVKKISQTPESGIPDIYEVFLRTFSTILSSAISFSFRYRRRGNDDWFDLKAPT